MRIALRRFFPVGRWLGATLFAAALLGASSVSTGSLTAGASGSSVPHYDHVFLIMEENHGFQDVIGNAAAPNLNSYADQFGLATQYYTLPGSSEPNYVGILGGNTFGISSDDPYWVNHVTGPSLISELDQAGVSWKAYLQSLPHPGYQDICFPAKCNGAPDSDPLFVSKHDAIQNFSTSNNTTDWNNQVPMKQLATDIANNSVPRFSYVIPDECHDMHGDPPYCLDSGNIGDAQDQHLVAVGDEYLGQLVSQITNAPFWAQGNNAIAIAYDEGDDSSGCCDANPGDGQVATIVITSHGPRAIHDATPSNHYSMLSTLQSLLGVPCLQFTCDTANVQPMLPLFAVTGSKAIATKTISPPTFATPTPTPTNEPVASTQAGPSGAGWTVQSAQILGQSDNSLGAVAASSPTDVWAVGNYLPDVANANPDATLSLAEHYDGHSWSVVPTPNTGVNFNSFYGAAASQGKAWAVGTYLNSDYQNRALIESWNGSAWTIDSVPAPGARRDMLFGASASAPDDVWAVGAQQAAGGGGFATLAYHWNGSSWSAVPTADPGSNENLLYGVVAVDPNDAWAVGQQVGTQGPDQALVEHWDGKSWSSVGTPAQSAGTTMLNAVAAQGDNVYAVGQVDSPDGGGKPLIETYDGSSWKVAKFTGSAGSSWTSLWGVAATSDSVWVGGTFLDLKTDNNNPLLLHQVNGNWVVANGPAPGSGSNIIGGLASSGDSLWAAGLYDDGNQNLPLIEAR